MTRQIRLEIEVPGTPEEVWEAIATGPGITAWFVPCTVDGRPGGTLTQDFGGGAVVEGQVTRWEPPAAFAYGSAGEPEPGDLAFEFLVEARAGGTCLVRLVNGGFGDGREWDDEYDSMHEGWKVFLLNLRLHLTHFPGQECHSVMANGVTAGPRAAAWKTLTGVLGLPEEPAEGDWVAAHVEGGPHFGGRVVHTTPGRPGFALLTDLPAPGIVLVGAEGQGPTAMLSLYGYFRGPTGIDAATAGRTAWTAWMGALAPVPRPTA